MSGGHLDSCPRCGGDVRFVERTNTETPTDHHNHIYECGECSHRIVAG